MRRSMTARTALVTAITVAMVASCGGSRDTGHFNPDGTTDSIDDITLDGDDDVAVDTLPDTGGDVPVDSPWDTTPDAPEDPGIDPMPEPYPDGTDVTDTDGDTIRDADEGSGTVDTDGDTIPDSEDLDSDADGIPDSYEAGDSDPLTSPVDSDFDGTPDFRDLDADDDTIRDSDEGVADVDGDGIPNYRDLDSDGDYLQDFFEAGDADLGTGPVDHDGDTVADYLDDDSDGDTISDLDESNIDTGEDGSYDYLNTDSDSDTIPDREEAGDYDLSTPPDNCDDDTLPNYRDTDSDNDGIADASEAAYGTDRCNADTDGDGVTDLVEIAYGSNPLNPGDSPRTHGDFVFEVPYNEAPIPTVDTLVFSTDLQMADVFFTMDSSGSMSGEIANLRDTLRTTVVPGILAAIPDVWFGVGRFEECDPSYCSNDMAMLQAQTDNITLVENAIASMTNLCGGWEPYTNNIYGIATGNVSIFSHWNGVHPLSWTCTPPGSIGWPCFRPGAVPIVVQFGDESFSEALSYCDPVQSRAAAYNALNSINGKYIGVNSGSSRADMIQIANGSGSVDSGGSPLVFDVSSTGSGLGTQVVDAVDILANQVAIRVDAIASDDPSDLVNAVTAFINSIHTNTSGTSIWDPILGTMRICTSGVPTATPGTPPTTDYFSAVLPGVPVCFDIFPKMNVTVAPTTDPQIFRAIVDVIGNGFTPLDSRDVYFLVPPVIPGGN
jgi:hypothetical protein